MNTWNKQIRHLAIIFASIILLSGVIWVVGPADILHDLAQFPAWSIVAVLAISALNLLIVSLRLSQTLAHFGTTIPYDISLRASVVGHLAGLFVMSIFGQVVGRHMALRRHGISSALIAMLTVYERVVLILIGGMLCLGGAVLLIDRSTIIAFLTEISVLETAFICVCGFALSQWVGRSQFEARMLSKVRSLKNIMNFFSVSAITLVAQVFVLGAFVVGVLALNPQADLLNVIAAAAIISFAASMPVTVNGWGVRELAAVYILGHLGISSSNALAVSILVGLCSTVVILAAAPWALKKASTEKVQNFDTTSAVFVPLGGISKFEIEKLAVWLIAMAAGVLIFFQTHLALPSGPVNLNLADPFAIIALAVVIAQVIATGQAPRWRVKGFNWALALISVLFVFAFVRGVEEIGVTQWAFASRLMGWLVLLGYLSIGYLLVSLSGTHGLRRFAEIMISTVVIVVLFQIVSRWLTYVGFDTFPIGVNFEGYSGNRNAFALQLLVCSVLVLSYSTVQFRFDRQTSHNTATLESITVSRQWSWLRGLLRPRRVLFSLLHGIILGGIIFTGSLGGFVTGIVLLAIAWVLRLADRRLIELSVLVCLVIWQMPQVISWIQEQFGFDGAGNLERMISTHFSGDESHYVRWQTYVKGFEMWRESPLFGAGLGVFIEQSTQWIDRPTVIHNTAIWILAELGLFGLVIFLWAFYVLVRFLRQDGTPLPTHRMVLMLLLVFSVFSMVHEIFFQRVFWLALGAGVALSASTPRVRAAASKLVCHIITGLDAGGAERMLTRLVSAGGQGNVRHTVVSLMDEGVFGKDIRAQGVPLHVMGMHKRFPSPIAFFRLVWLLRSKNPDVLMTWLYHADLLGFFAGSLSGIKRIYWNLRCSDMTQSNGSILNWMLMRLLVHLSPYPLGVVANSEAGKLHHQKLGYSPKAWYLLPNGVNLDVFHPRPEAGQALRTELSLPQDAILVGNVARFHPMKDHTTLLDAAVEVAKVNANVHFILIGKDVSLDTPFISKRIQCEELSGRVHALGARSNIHEILPGLDLLISSSAYGEGAPNVIIEAMACGVPCITSDVGDAAAIVADSKRVVQPRDPHALATVTLEFLALPKTVRKALGQQALVRIQEHYDIKFVIDRYRALFLTES